MITFTDEQGSLGTISRTGTGLAGSNDAMQRMANRALHRAHGSVPAAYAILLASGNPYVQVRETADLSGQPDVIELTRSPAWLHELRKPNGEWTRTPGDKPGTGLDRYTVPPHDRLINPRADVQDPADYPFFKKHPVSAQNIIDAYDAVPEEMRPDGMRWYADAHLLSKALAHGNSEEGAILLANYSPQANWPINMFRAARVADEGKPIPAGQGYITNDQVKKAQKALDGMHVDEVLVSPKTRSFAHLLAVGDDSPDDPYGHVVIDAHALNVAAGGTIRGATYQSDEKRKKIPKEDLPPLDDARAHEYVGDMYREAAHVISQRDGVLIKPHQMQAITWVAQVLANQAEDRAQMEAAEGGVLGRAKGRLSARAKDWQRWLAYAKAHHLQLVPGVSALAYEAMLAQIIELAGEDSIFTQFASQPGGTISGQIDLFNPSEPRDPKGRWVKGGIAEQLAARETAYQQVKAGREARRAAGGREYPMMGPEHARGNSRAVSADEFQELARKGNAWIDRAKNNHAPAAALAGPGLAGIKARAYEQVRKSWGGATINPRTGEFLPDGADLYALSIKPRGMITVSVPEDASADEFGTAVDRAIAMFSPALERAHFHLGVFHDDDNHRIDLDPVAIVDSTDLVEQVGAYTHAIGGAYHFRTGDGYWPPHVAEGAGMANDDDKNKIHFAGPGEWHSQAVAVQDPEPDDTAAD